MNNASCIITYLLKHYCSASKISKITGDSFFVNLIRNFKYDFESYLYRYCHVRILSYSTLKSLIQEVSYSARDSNDLFIYYTERGTCRPVKKSDAGAVKSLIRKWYQFSGEINLRIVLLLDSKIGSRYIARITGVPQKIISSIRHRHTPINNVKVEYRLNLENMYLNSKLARRTASVKVKI